MHIFSPGSFANSARGVGALRFNERQGGDDIDYDKQEADVIARIRQAKEKIVAQTSDFANKRVAVVAELAEAKAEER